MFLGMAKLLPIAILFLPIGDIDSSISIGKPLATSEKDCDYDSDSDDDVKSMSDR